jgi:hypothetical protein
MNSQIGFQPESRGWAAIDFSQISHFGLSSPLFGRLGRKRTQAERSSASGA